jgi:hypothetical protein
MDTEKKKLMKLQARRAQPHDEGDDTQITRVYHATSAFIEVIGTYPIWGRAGTLLHKLTDEEVRLVYRQLRSALTVFRPLDRWPPGCAWGKDYEDHQHPEEGWREALIDMIASAYQSDWPEEARDFRSIFEVEPRSPKQ